MNQRKFFAMALFLIAAFSIRVPMVRADESNEETKLTFSEAVEIPGQTLPAGTYWFVLANINSNRDLVQILSHVPPGGGTGGPRRAPLHSLMCSGFA